MLLALLLKLLVVLLLILYLALLPPLLVQPLQAKQQVLVGLLALHLQQVKQPQQVGAQIEPQQLRSIPVQLQLLRIRLRLLRAQPLTQVSRLQLRLLLRLTL